MARGHSCNAASYRVAHCGSGSGATARKSGQLCTEAIGGRPAPVPPTSRPRARLQQARTIDAVVKHDAAIKVSDGTQATETEARDVAMDENDDVRQ